MLGAPRALRGLSNFPLGTSTVYRRLQTGSSAGDYFVGSSFGWAAAVLFRVNNRSVTSATRTPLNCQGGAGTAGFSIRSQTTWATILGQTWNTVPTSFSTPIYTIAAGDVGKVLGAVIVLDVTNFRFRLYVNRVEVGTGTAFSGSYSANSNISYMGNGAGGTAGNDQGDIFGAAAGDGIPTLANIQAWFDTVKIARCVVAIPGMNANIRVWNPAYAGGSLYGMYDKAAASGADGKNMVPSGTASELTAVADFNPTWGW